MESGVVALNVHISDVPENLFGAAFHVVTSGVEWELLSYQQGSVFDTPDPFLLVTEKEGALITGISLRRAESATIHDGKLITFFIQPSEEGDIFFDFDYPVLSMYNNGRKDVEDVQWLGIGVTNELEMEENRMEEIQDEENVEALTLQSTYADVLENGAITSATLSNIYWLLFGLFLLFTTIFAVYFWWTRKRSSL